MFDLEQAISDWRRRMVDCGFNSVDVLEEMESHLRDDIEAQVRCGVNGERAFELAIGRLGAPAELKKEFTKLRRPEAAQSRTFLRYFYFVCALAAILIDLWSLISFDLSLPERVGAAAGIALFALYLFGLPIWSRLRGGIPGACLVGAMKVFGAIVPLWVLFALLTALRTVRWEIGIMPEMIMWSLCALYGLTALAWASDFDIPIPPSEAFTPAARLALELARQEALGLGHDFVGTEHVLLGLLRTPSGTLAEALQANSEAVRAEVHRLISAVPPHSAVTEPPLTPRARKALQFAGREAAFPKRSRIGTEHILLGLLLEGGGLAAIALRNLDIRLEQVRTDVPRH